MAAWPVDSFVENNDFTGKTVIPFCTSASSGIGDSGNLLADLAGTGDWQEGQRFSSSPDEAEVQEWGTSYLLTSKGEWRYESSFALAVKYIVFLVLPAFGVICGQGDC